MEEEITDAQEPDSEADGDQWMQRNPPSVLGREVREEGETL